MSCSLGRAIVDALLRGQHVAVVGHTCSGMEVVAEEVKRQLITEHHRPPISFVGTAARSSAQISSVDSSAEDHGTTSPIAVGTFLDNFAPRSFEAFLSSLSSRCMGMGSGAMATPKVAFINTDVCRDALSLINGWTRRLREPSNLGSIPPSSSADDEHLWLLSLHSQRHTPAMHPENQPLLDLLHGDTSSALPGGGGRSKVLPVLPFQRSLWLVPTRSMARAVRHRAFSGMYAPLLPSTASDNPWHVYPALRTHPVLDASPAESFLLEHQSCSGEKLIGLQKVLRLHTACFTVLELTPRPEGTFRFLVRVTHPLKKRIFAPASSDRGGGTVQASAPWLKPVAQLGWVVRPVENLLRAAETEGLTGLGLPPPWADVYLRRGLRVTWLDHATGIKRLCTVKEFREHPHGALSNAERDANTTTPTRWPVVVDEQHNETLVLPTLQTHDSPLTGLLTQAYALPLRHAAAFTPHQLVSLQRPLHVSSQEGLLCKRLEKVFFDANMFVSSPGLLRYALQRSSRKLQVTGAPVWTVLADELRDHATAWMALQHNE